MDEAIRTLVTRSRYASARLGRRARELLLRPPKVSLQRHFVFMHIPKAGGSTTRHLLRALFRERDIVPDTLLSGFPDYHHVQRSQPSAYMGHLGYRFAASAGADTATLLREPIDRLLSLHAYATTPRLRQPLIGGVAPGMPLLEFLQSDYAGIRMNVDNAMVWQLASCYSERERHRLAGIGDDELLHMARENLAVVAIPGVIEHLDLFARRLQAHFGIAVQLPAKKRNPGTGNRSQETLNQAERDALLAVTELDRALYASALALLQAPDKKQV